jgi:hypothetical protein
VIARSEPPWDDVGLGPVWPEAGRLFMDSEDKTLPERRQSPTRPIGPYMFRGRRMKSWREGDVNYYVDRYGPKLFAIICAILLMGVLDAYLTIRILHLGGSELNALMRWLLDHKPGLAITLKYLILAASVTILVIHKNFVVFRGLKIRTVLYAVFVLYGILVSYEAYVVVTCVRIAGPSI